MDRWYVARAIKHHRVWQVVSKNTGAMRYTDTIKLKHHIMAIPIVLATDRTVKAQGSNKNSPPEELEAIEVLEALLNGTPPPVHFQETERAPASSGEAILVQPQGDHDILQEETPSQTGDAEDSSDQQYHIISQDENVYPPPPMMSFPHCQNKVRLAITWRLISEG